jgi:hypothetical protein
MTGANQMNEPDQNKPIGPDENAESIIRQHRRWTYWVEGRRILGEGNLVLTNRRLLFLHRIESSPEVAASIKNLADAPMETVLDHALTLHKNSFQMPLSSIIQVGIGSLAGFPLPSIYLNVVYLKGKKLSPHTVAFKFKQSGAGMFSQPQIVMDWNWKRAIRKAIEETGRTKNR